MTGLGCGGWGRGPGEHGALTRLINSDSATHTPAPADQWPLYTQTGAQTSDTDTHTRVSECSPGMQCFRFLRHSILNSWKPLSLAISIKYAESCSTPLYGRFVFYFLFSLFVKKHLYSSIISLISIFTNCRGRDKSVKEYNFSKWTKQSDLVLRQLSLFWEMSGRGPGGGAGGVASDGGSEELSSISVDTGGSPASSSSDTRSDRGEFQIKWRWCDDVTDKAVWRTLLRNPQQELVAPLREGPEAEVLPRVQGREVRKV